MYVGTFMCLPTGLTYLPTYIQVFAAVILEEGGLNQTEAYGLALDTYLKDVPGFRKDIRPLLR